MRTNTFLATTSYGLVRASRSASDEWSVALLLTDQDVRCLAADPLNQDVISAGTQGKGVLRSNDGARTWRPAGLAGQRVKATLVGHVWNLEAPDLFTETVRVLITDQPLSQELVAVLEKERKRGKS